MTKYIFVFGRTPGLSFVELVSRVPTATLIEPPIAVAECEDNIHESLIHQLGGTVKIAKYLDTVDTITPEHIAGVIQKDIQGSSITFGISIIGSKNASINGKLLTGQVKDLLSSPGIHVRYVLPKTGQELGSVVVEKNDVYELNIISGEGGWIIAHTVAVQPFEAWSERDFDRPAVDPHAGMLPPKVARMAVNIAGLQGTFKDQPLVIDPFCGVGTILGEALLSGFSVYGMDISREAITKSIKNLEWLTEKYTLKDVFAKDVKLWRTAVFDATHLSELLYPKSVDAIVTEPYLGDVRFGDEKKRAQVTAEDVKNAIKGLDRLYLGCMKEWATILKPGGKVVIAFPAISHGRTEYRVKKTIDTCETLGYTKLLGPLTYSRPQAIVKREFYVFVKHS